MIIRYSTRSLIKKRIAPTAMPLRVGYHVSKSKGLYKNIQNLILEGGQAVQFFLSPNKGFYPGIPLKDEEVKAILKLKEEHDLYLVTHGKYILNFARPDNQKAKKPLITDLIQAARLGTNVIIHQGKNVKELDYTRQTALETFVENLTSVLDETEKLGITNKIVLENSCQQGTEMGFTIVELAKIYSMFQPKYQERLSFCLDLCHIYVAGVLNVCQPTEIDQFFQDFDALIGLDKLEVIHFNDSRVRFNGHNDSHADILVGHIGNPLLGGSSSGFRRIVEFAEERNIPLILETPSIDEEKKKNPNGIPYINQIRLLKSWSKASSEPDFETEYKNKHQIRMEEFAGNPVSSKGRKKEKEQEKSGEKEQEKQEITQQVFKPKILLKKIQQSPTTPTKPKLKTIIIKKHTIE